MNPDPTMPSWALALYIGLAVIVAAAMLGISHLLGQRHQGRATHQPFESGIAPAEHQRLRFPINYFRLALFFVVFDLEVAFLVVWAVSAKELGWLAYAGVVVFVLMLLLGLFYLWREGALEWGSSAKLRQRKP